MRQTHTLKTWRKQFDAVVSGVKRFEYRRDDRGFNVGDQLVLRKWDEERECYAQQEVRVEVTYIARGPDFGIPQGYCVMSIELPW